MSIISSLRRMVPRSTSWRPQYKPAGRYIHEAASDLNRLNQMFLRSYAVRKEEIRQSIGKSNPVILLHGDNLILRHNGKREAVQYIPAEYHHLKSVAHVSCLIHTLNVLCKEGASGEADKARAECLAIIGRLGKSPELEKHRPILTQYHKLLSQEGEMSLSSLKPMLEPLIEEAAKCRLDALHKQVRRIQRTICPMAWKNLAVIVMGPAMPRKGELGLQYFHALLKNPADGALKDRCPHLKDKPISDAQRVVYAESIDDEERALDLLTTHICDEPVGEAVLGDKNVMHADVLQDAAKKHLQAMKLSEDSS